MTVELMLGDCLEEMKKLKDKSIDLILCDPPYGLEWSPTTLFGKETPQTKSLNDLQRWDKKPNKEIFDEIIRIGKNWIIWGGNYFADYLGACRSPLIWDKKTGDNNYADGEMAFTSFQKGTLRIFRHQWCGAFKDSERGIQNLHPTQKPVELMLWCIRKVPEAKTILDPFMGSGTTGVACVKLDRNFIGMEIDPKYFEIAKRRITEEENRLKLF